MNRIFAVALTILLLSATTRLFAADPAPTTSDVVVDFGSEINLAPAYAQKPMGQWVVGGGLFYKDDWGLSLAGGYQFNNGVAVLGQVLGQDSPFPGAPPRRCCSGCPEGDNWGVGVLVLVPLPRH